VPPTPIPENAGLGSAAKLWEWNEVARPSAVAASTTRLAVIIADGRFAWLDADSGQVNSSTYLWSGILQGDSWGEVYADGLGTLAVVAAREQSISPQTGLADSRSRLAVYDAQANELWSLPELGAQHFYSAALTSVSVVAGTWPQGFSDNTLASYELYTGEKQWEVTEGDSGFAQIAHDGNRLYTLIRGTDQDTIAAFDLRTGEELWRWVDDQVVRPDLIALDASVVYVLSVNETLAIDATSGNLLWRVTLHAAPEAGMAVLDGNLFLAPSPAAELGFRPGIISLFGNGSGLAWHSLTGLLADPVAAGDDAIWAIVKDYDSGEVYLSGLEPLTGLEKIRLEVAPQPEVLYQITAFGRRVYILGNSLIAFGY
jgi:hypothetical protein